MIVTVKLTNGLIYHISPQTFKYVPLEQPAKEFGEFQAVYPDGSVNPFPLSEVLSFEATNGEPFHTADPNR